MALVIVGDSSDSYLDTTVGSLGAHFEVSTNKVCDLLLAT